MKNILKLILSGIIFFGAVPTVQANDSMAKAGMEEVKKKKKKKGKKISEKGKKKKKGFFSKIFGSK
jgi:muconolactone delta-isomerase